MRAVSRCSMAVFDWYRKRSRTPASAGCRVGDQAQGLVAVGGQNHVVEGLDAAVARGDFDPAGDRLHARHGRGEANPADQRTGQPGDIQVRSAGHGSPARPLDQVEELVVVKELHEGARRERQHGLHRARPDGRRHRQQMVVDEAGSIAFPPQPLAERRPRSRLLEELLGAREEPQDVRHHAPVARPDQVSRLGQHAAQRAFVLQPAVVDRNPEAHVARLGGDAEALEQRDQVRVVAIVVDDEAGVDGDRRAVVVDGDGVGVTAEPALGLVHGDLMPGPQQPRGAEAGDAGTDHGDAHVVPRSLMSGLFTRPARFRIRPASP